MEKILKIQNNREDTMEESKLKNMVVLKNLPSNLIEEAIIVLKSNKKVKKLEKIDKEKKNETSIVKNNTTKRDFVVKEAEVVLASYISKIENNNKINKQKKIEQNKKIRRLKNYAFLSSLIIFVQLLLLIIN